MKGILDIRVQNYDSVIKEYDQLFKINESIAHSFMKIILQSKDVAIEKTEALVQSKDALVQSKDETISVMRARIQEKENQVLGLKGLLTSRGVFENYMEFCLTELKSLSLVSSTQKFNVGLIIETMTKEQNSQKLPKDGHCRKIVEEARNCQADLKKVYSTLSREVHGSPWSGPGLKIRLDEMEEKDKCIVLFIANSMLLTYE